MDFTEKTGNWRSARAEFENIHDPGKLSLGMWCQNTHLTVLVKMTWEKVKRIYFNYTIWCLFLWPGPNIESNIPPVRNWTEINKSALKHIIHVQHMIKTWFHDKGLAYFYLLVLFVCFLGWGWWFKAHWEGYAEVCAILIFFTQKAELQITDWHLRWVILPIFVENNCCIRPLFLICCI